MTNAFASLIRSYEYLSGLIPIDTIGGSEQHVPAHERVIMDSCESCFADTQMTGLG
jgi:hypothetical protein